MLRRWILVILQEQLKKVKRLHQTVDNHNRDKDGVLSVVTFMCFNHGYFHAWLKLSHANVTKKEAYIIPPVYVDIFYYCTGELKSILKPVKNYGLSEYFGVLLTMYQILLENIIDVLYSNKSLVYQIFGVKTQNNFNVGNIFLQLLVSRILDCVVEEVVYDTKTQLFLVWLNINSTCNPF